MIEIIEIWDMNNWHLNNVIYSHSIIFLTKDNYTLQFNSHKFNSLNRKLKVKKHMFFYPNLVFGFQIRHAQKIFQKLFFRNFETLLNIFM